MSIASDKILNLVASEQGFLASILSSEALKTQTSARWLAIISEVSIGLEDFNAILAKSISIESSVANVIRATADKEIAIAAKVGAVLSNKCCPKITWIATPPISTDC